MVAARRDARVAELPHTATGKIQKLVLRERYRDHYLEELRSLANARLTRVGEQTVCNPAAMWQKT